MESTSQRKTSASLSLPRSVKFEMDLEGSGYSHSRANASLTAQQRCVLTLTSAAVPTIQKRPWLKKTSPGLGAGPRKAGMPSGVAFFWLARTRMPLAPNSMCGAMTESKRRPAASPSRCQSRWGYKESAPGVALGTERTLFAVAARRAVASGGALGAGGISWLSSQYLGMLSPASPTAPSSEWKPARLLPKEINEWPGIGALSGGASN